VTDGLVLDPPGADGAVGAVGVGWAVAHEVTMSATAVAILRARRRKVTVTRILQERLRPVTRRTGAMIGARGWRSARARGCRPYRLARKTRGYGGIDGARRSSPCEETPTDGLSDATIAETQAIERRSGGLIV
jgi:hypothetical protein